MVFVYLLPDSICNFKATNLVTNNPKNAISVVQKVRDHKEHAVLILQLVAVVGGSVCDDPKFGALLRAAS